MDEITTSKPSLTSSNHTEAWRWLARDLADKLKSAVGAERNAILASIKELDDYLMAHAA